MISFRPSDDQKMMVDAVAEFAKNVLRPRLREFEAARGIPDDVRKAAHDMGLGGVALPAKVGGPGFGLTTAVLVEEELGWGDPAAAFGFGGPGSFGLCVSELGTESQAAGLLAHMLEPGGHDHFGAVAWGEPRANRERPGLSTTAEKHAKGWKLRGEKAYVLNADRADRFVVFAQVDPAQGYDGLGAFVVNKGAPGLTVTPRLTTLGLDAASFGGLSLQGVEVAEDDRLVGGSPFEAGVVRFFVKQALIVAARAVGLSRAAFDITREYCDSRVAFGKPIGHFQAVAFTLADRAMEVDAARSLVWRAAYLWDSGRAEGAASAAPSSPGGADREALLASAFAISFALETAMRCGDDGVQLHGGAGFMRDYPVEKLMRDAKQLQLCCLTAEHADQLAAAIELERPLDLGTVLPTAESQSAFV